MKRIYIYIIQVISALIAIIGFGIFVENSKVILDNIEIIGYILIACGLSLTAIVLFILRSNPAKIKMKNRAIILLVCAIGISILTISKLVNIFIIGELNKDSMWAGAGVFLGAGVVFYFLKDFQKIRNTKDEKEN